MMQSTPVAGDGRAFHCCMPSGRTGRSPLPHAERMCAPTTYETCGWAGSTVGFCERTAIGLPSAAVVAATSPDVRTHDGMSTAAGHLHADRGARHGVGDRRRAGESNEGREDLD